MQRLILAAMVATLTLAIGVAGHGGGHAEIREQTFEAEGTVVPAGFAEVDFGMEAGDRLEWSVEATADVNVNLHVHEMGTTYLVQENRTRDASGRFVAPDNGTYSLMIVGAGPEPADVEVRLEGRFGVEGVSHLDEVTAEAAGGAAVLALCILVVTVALLRR